MADYVEVTEAETTAAAFLRQALGRKFRNNFINHQARITALESNIIAFDHFLGWVSCPVDFDGSGAAPKERIFNQRWLWAFQGQAGTPADPTFPAYSVVRLDADGNASNDAAHSGLYSLQDFVFDNVTKPITYKARVQWRGQRANHDPIHRWGMHASYYTSVGTPNAPYGIYLEMPNNTDFRFSCKSSAGVTTGTLFTRPIPDAWFEVRIDFTDDPSDRAVCYIDDVPKETLITNLPTTDRLRGSVICAQDYVGGGGAGSTPYQVDIDRIRYTCEGLTDAA